MTALLLTEVFPPQTGGSGRWFWEIYRRLPREQVVIAAGEHPQAAEFDSAHDLRLTRLPLALPTWGMLGLAGLRGYWKLYRQVRRLMRRERVTQLHCGKVLPEGWLAWLAHKRTGLPYRCYVHGEEINISQQSRELMWMTSRVFADAQQIIVNSQNTARIVQQAFGLRRDKIHVLHPGVDVLRFVPAELDERVRDRLGWTGRTVILTVGRLQIRKGHDMLIRALPQIVQSQPNVLYAIFGEGGERTRLEQLAVELGVREQVRFYGELSDEQIIQGYQQCDLFVLPNREVAGDIEGFGMVLLEAQACGKAVIAGRSGGTAETMQVGETGLLAACETPEPLADAVLSLLSDDEHRQAMGRRGRLWTESQFAWEALAAQAQELFFGPPLSDSSHHSSLASEVA